MFKKMQNIETAFQRIRGLMIAIVVGFFLTIGWLVYLFSSSLKYAQSRVYLLNNGKVLEAVAADRNDNIGVEARDHVANFHRFFFTLSPDEKAIRETINRALYLADESAKKAYDNLSERSFYANLISGNVSQQITVDSVMINLERYPYAFRCYATEKIIRTTSTVIRKLITAGELRNVGRSDNNPHGFLIQRWTILENSDQKVTNQ